MNTSTGEPSNNIPPDPAFAPYPSTTGGRLRNEPVLLPSDPLAGAQQYARFVLGPVAARRHGHRLGHGGVRHDHQRVGGELQPQRRSPALGHRGPGVLPPVRRHRPRRPGRVGAAHPAQPGHRSRRSTARCEISGNFTQATAKNLALELNYGVAAGAAQASSTRRPCRRPWASRRSRPGWLAGIGGLILVLHLHDPLLPGPRASWWSPGSAHHGRAAVGHRLRPGPLGAEPDPGPVRRHRPDRVGRDHRRLLHRVLRAIKGRGALAGGRCAPAWTGASRGPSGRCWPPTRCRWPPPSCSTSSRSGTVRGLRLLPRPVDPARRVHHVLLHPAPGHPAGPQRQGSPSARVIGVARGLAIGSETAA